MEIEKLERQKENVSTKLLQTEKDLQLALKAEQQAHEEDLERLTKEKVGQALEMVTFMWSSPYIFFLKAPVTPYRIDITDRTGKHIFLSVVVVWV